MDVFYYWKNFDADQRAGRIGTFKSSAEKLSSLAEGYPDYIWAFRTPKGRLSELQLVARLRWSDKPGGSAAIVYDAKHVDSVLFTDSSSDHAMAAVTNWVSRHFPKIRSANFQGTSGQEAIRGVALNELVALAKPFTSEPLRLIPTSA